MSNPTVHRDICGTKQGFYKHKDMFEKKCQPCLATYRLEPARLNIDELVTEIEHLLSLGQGVHYTLKALGYLGREESLRKRLYARGKHDLYRRVITDEYMAAA